jgi:hypothetical protein
MPLTRKNKLVAALVAALVLMPAIPAPLTPAPPSPPDHPPVMQLGILPKAARLRRQRRYATDVTIGARLLRRLRETKAWIRARGLNLRPRLPMRESYARGPPRRGQQ